MDGSVGSATGRLGLDTSDFEGGIDRAAAKADTLANAFNADKIAGAMQDVGFVVAGVGATVTAGFTKAVFAAADFEAGVNAVQAAVNPDEWNQYGAAIEDLALSLGKDYPASAMDAIAVTEELALQGISLEDILGGAAEGVVLLANATGTEFVPAAEIAATAMNQFGYSGEDMVMIADLLTNGANESATSVEGMGKALQFVGNTAANLNVPLDEVITSFAIVSQRGINSSKMGTGLNRIFSNLSKTTGVAHKELTRLGLAQGGVNSVFKDNGDLKSMPEIIDNVRKATEGMTDADRNAALQKAFNVEGANVMLALLANEEEALNGNGRGWDEYAEAINRSGSAEEAATIRMQGLRGALELLGGSIDELMIRVGSVFLPVFTRVALVAARVVDAISSLPAPILTVVSVIGALAGVAAVLVGGLMVLSPFLLSLYRAFVLIQGVGVATIFSRIGLAVRGLLGPLGALGPRVFSLGGIFRTFGAVATLAIRGVTLALRSLLFSNPLLTIAGLALIAYTENWFGFADGVNWAVGKAVAGISRLVSWVGRITGITDAINAVREAWRVFGEAMDSFSQTGNKVSAVFNAIAAAIRSLDIGILSTVADFFDTVGFGISSFWREFNKGGGKPKPIEQTVTLNGDDKTIEWIYNDQGEVERYAIMRAEEDGSLTEVGEILESWDDPDDPNLIHARVRVDGQEFETFIDRDTGRIHDAEVKITVDSSEVEDSRGKIDRLTDGLDKATAYLENSKFPFLAELPKAASSALKGFQKLQASFEKFRKYGSDPIHASLGALSEVFPQLDRVVVPLANTYLRLTQTFRALRELGVNPVSAALLALSNTFPRLRGALDPIANAISELVTNFQLLRDQGLNPVEAAIGALGATFETLQPIMTELMGLVQDLQQAFSAFLDGDFSTGFSELGSAARNAWDVLQEGVSLLGDLAVAAADWAINVGVPRVIGLASDLWDAVSGWVSEVWPTVSDTAHQIADVAINIANWARGKAPRVWTFLRDWVTTLIDTAGSVASAVREVAINIARWAQGTAPRIWTFLRGWIDGLISAAGNLASQVREVVVNIARWAQGTAPRIWTFLRGWIDTLISTAGDMASSVRDVVVNIASWAQGTAPRIWTFLRGWIDTLLATAGSVASQVREVVVNIARWAQGTAPRLWSFITGWVDTLIGTLGSLARNIGSVTLRITQWLFEQGEDLASRLKSQVVTWLASFGITSTDLITVGNAIVNALQDAITLGLQTVADLASAVLDWATDQIDDIEWEGVGNTVGTKIGEAIRNGIIGLAGALALGVYLLAELLLAIVDVDWDSFGSSLKAFLESAVKAGFEFSKGFVQGLFDALFDGISFQSVLDIGKNIGIELWNGIIDGLSTTDFGRKLIDTLGLEKILPPGMKDAGEKARSALMDGILGGIDWDSEPIDEMPGMPTPEISAEPVGFGNFGPMLAKQLGASVGSAMDTVNTTTVPQKVQALMTAFQTGLQPLGSRAATAFAAIGPAIQPPLTSVGTAVGTSAGTWAASLGSAAVPLGTAAAAAFGQVPMQVPLALGAVGPAIGLQAAGWSTGITLQGMALGVAALSAFGNVPTNAATSLGEVGAEIGIAAAGWSTGLVLQGMVLGLAATTAFTSALTAAQTVLQTITTAVTTQAGAWVMIVGAQAGGMGSSATSVFTAALSAAQSILQTITTAVTTQARAWVTIVSSQSGAMGNAARSMMQAALSAMQSVLQTITTAVTTQSRAWPQIVGANVGQIAGVITSRGGAAISAASSLGRQIGNGMAAGMEAALGRIRAAAQAMVNAALVAAQAQAMISSPSRLFEREVGEEIPAGMIGGMEKLFGRVRQTGQAMVDAAMVRPQVPGWMSDLAGRFASPMGAMAASLSGGGAAGGVGSIVFSPQYAVTQRDGEDTEALARRLNEMAMRDLRGLLGG